MPETRDFDLADILSITDGRLVSHNHIGGVYKILNFMTGDELFTHQLPRAADQCKPELLRQHPWLSEVELPAKGAPVADLFAALTAAEERWGMRHPVTAGVPDYQHVDAVAELDQMAGNRPVIVARAPMEH